MGLPVDEIRIEFEIDGYVVSCEQTMVDPESKESRWYITVSSPESFDTPYDSFAPDGITTFREAVIEALVGSKLRTKSQAQMIAEDLFRGF